MSVLVSDVIVDVKNYARNQNLTDARVISAINTGIDFVSAHLGLPGHERQYTFNYFESEHYVIGPSDWEEPISLHYDEDRLNRFHRFSWKPPELMYERLDAVDHDTSLWSYDFASGVGRLIVLARNSTASVIIDTMDGSAANWIASNDATNVTDDYITYKEGGGSLMFDVNVGLSGGDVATITRTFSNGFDLSTMNDQGYALCDFYIPNITGLSSISLSWGTDASNYWTQTVLEQADGTPFQIGWNEISLPWYGASVVGIPVPTLVPWFKLDLSYTVAYVSTPSFRVDYLMFQKPDRMIASYYTNYRGQSTLGAYLSVFTSPTDTFLFGTFDPALRQLVAINAAVSLNPQILVDNKSVAQQYSEFFSLYSRKYPKKRTNNLMVDPKITRTNHN